MNRNDQYCSGQERVIPGVLSLAAALAVPILIGLFLLITSTIYLSPTVAVLDTKRMLQLTIVLVIMLIPLLEPGIRLSFTRQVALIPNWIGYGFLLFFGLGIASSLVNAGSLFSLAYSLVEVYLLVLVVFIALIVAACRSVGGELFDRVAISSMVLLSLAVGMQELVGVFVSWSAGYQFSYDVALTHFAHPRFYNQLQSWSVPVIVALPVLFPSKRLAAVLCVLALGLNWYILLMTGSRGSTLSLTVVMIAAVLFIPAIRGTIIKWQLAGILLGIGIYGFMFIGPDAGLEPPSATTVLSHNIKPEASNGARADAPAEPDRVDFEGSNTFFNLSLGRPMMHSSGRINLWKAAVGYAGEKPLLGIGPMNYACQGPISREGHPHNFALQIMSEWGIPALLILTFVLFGIFVKMLPGLKGTYLQQDTAGLKIKILLATGVFSAALLSCLSGVLMTPASQMMGALILGWLLSSYSLEDYPVLTRKSRYIATGVLALMLLAGLGFLLFANNELSNMRDYRAQAPANEKAIPRFWQFGKACYPDPGLTTNEP